MAGRSGFDLKLLLKKRLIDEIFGANNKKDPYQVLVLDSHTSKVVGSCCKMSNLLAEGFVAIQNLEMNRQTIDLPATYFLEVSGQDDEKHRDDAERLTIVTKDFSEGPEWNPQSRTGRKLKKKYLRAYVNVTQTIKKSVISSILAKERRFVKNCRALNEVNIDFLSYESRVFLLNRPYALETLMKEDQIGESSRLIERITKQLVSLCITLNEKPYVRYEVPQTGSRIERYIELLADKSFESALRSATEKLPNWKPRPNPATLLFLNRTSDMAAPLIHHISYQSVLVDVLGMKGDVLNIEVEKRDQKTGEVEGKEIKSYVMDEEDEVWRAKRHKHFDAFKNELFAEIEAFKAKSTTQQARQKDLEMDQKTMLKVVKDLPKYREMTRMFRRHQNIIKTAGSAIKSKVPAITLLQDFACGFDHQASSQKPQSLWNRVTQILEDSETAYLDKASIAMLYVIARGGMTSSEKSFFESTLDTGTMTAVSNLKLLGFNTGNPQSSKAFSVERGHMDMMKSRVKKIISDKKAGKKGQHIIGNRYLTKVHYACSQLVEDKLDKKAFPYINPPPKTASRGTARTTGFSVRRNRNRRNSEGASDKARLIIFVLGGITASEMASVYEIGEQWNVEIIIGSTDIITSEEILKSLSLGEINKNQDLNPSAINYSTRV
mmetsp:Transcript_16420/g.22905  ORF Transcript_16420/g.22905 Transcript_16420/m.22905 type:complete len:663 (+) Transcript_16420:100-2088(+)